MDIPIQLALSYPERLNGSTKKLDFSLLSLDFHKPDFNRYPCLELALEVATKGLNYPCAMSGANEIAVELFLNGKIKFTQISKYVRHAIDLVIPKEPTFESLVETDYLAREAVITAYKEKKFE